MVDAFEQSCVPHNRCATAANESLTFTLPKEVSLCAEGDPEEAKAAMYAAAQKSLDAIYGDKRYTAAAAIHTRNENRESSITRTFSSENSQRIGRPPSFGASTAAAAERRDFGSSPN